MRVVRRAGVALASAVLALAVAVPAFAAVAPPGTNVKKGKTVFVTTACGVCHVLKAANARGTIGPNLNKTKPSYAKIILRVTNGKGTMTPYKAILSKTQIKDVAAFVFVSTHPS